MLIKIWIAITDGGDGEYRPVIYKSKEELIDDLIETLDYDGDNEGYGFDEYDYPVFFSSRVIDIREYEIVYENE